MARSFISASTERRSSDISALNSAIPASSVLFGYLLAAHFSDVKKHKPPAFSRKIRGLRFSNLAVKERFERPVRLSLFLYGR